MIQLDEIKLQNVLEQVLRENYPYAKDTIYVRIDNIDFSLEFSEDKKLWYTIIGAYGIENKWQKDLSIEFYTNWSWDYLAGYFNRYLLESELTELRRDYE